MARPECLDCSFAAEDDGDDTTSDTTKEEEDWECFSNDGLDNVLSDDSCFECVLEPLVTDESKISNPEVTPGSHTMAPATWSVPTHTSAVATSSTATTAAAHTLPYFPFSKKVRYEHHPSTSAFAGRFHAASESNTGGLPFGQFEAPLRPRQHRMGLSPSKPTSTSFDFSILAWRKWRAQVTRPPPPRLLPQQASLPHPFPPWAQHQRRVPQVGGMLQRNSAPIFEHQQYQSRFSSSSQHSYRHQAVHRHYLPQHGLGPMMLHHTMRQQQPGIRGHHLTPQHQPQRDNQRASSIPHTFQFSRPPPVPAAQPSCFK